MSRFFALLEDVWPLFALLVVYSLCMAAALFAYRRLRPNRDFDSSERILAACITLAIAGISTGYLTGLSRDAAIGSVVPAVLTAFGGFSTYLMTVQPKGRSGVVVAATISLFLFFMFAELTGSQVRGENEEMKIAEEKILELDFTEQALKAAAEAKIKKMRKELGLDDASLSTTPTRQPER